MAGVWDVAGQAGGAKSGSERNSSCEQRGSDISGEEEVVVVVLVAAARWEVRNGRYLG